MCLAQGHNTVTPVRLEHAALGSRVKHSTTVLPEMCIMTSKFISLHFKGTIMFTHFSDERMAIGKVLVTVSNFNAYFPHITGCFHLQIYAVFTMTNVNVTSH